ncbi:YrhB domain-containing protein [Planotetraspora mira]|uniref:YrhB domain-containing protein n=1 Tax=Planotetraspora mira TaxID=58121 RepID=UPI0019502114|nr:YrhB domain-containing protein [Planotetraspora mira]
MVTKVRAVELVEDLLLCKRRESPWMPELAVLDVEEHALGWLVFLQSVEYIRTREQKKMLVGQGPYLVDRRDESIHHIPVTTYATGDWAELYLRQVKGIRPPDPLVAAVREHLHSAGTMAAIRHLRKQAPGFGPQEAKTYVVAVRDGGEPPEELVTLTQKPEKCPPLSIETLTGPNRQCSS